MIIFLTRIKTFFPAILYFPSETFLTFSLSHLPLAQLQFFCICLAACCTFLSNSVVGVGVVSPPPIEDGLLGVVSTMSRSGSSPLPLDHSSSSVLSLGTPSLAPLAVTTGREDRGLSPEPLSGMRMTCGPVFHLSNVFDIAEAELKKSYTLKKM